MFICSSDLSTLWKKESVATQKHKKCILTSNYINPGPVELAAVGVSIALFNQVSRIAIFPLVSVTTSFVAEEDTMGKVSPEIQETENLEAGSENAESKKLISQTQNGMVNFLYGHFVYATLFTLLKPDFVHRFM